MRYNKVIHYGEVGVLRVLIELFDPDPVQNLVGTCVFEPDVVVFLCDKRDSSLVKESAVYRLLRSRRLRSVPRFYYVNLQSPAEIRRVLHAVLQDYPGCIFDYSGGSDLLLLLSGEVCIPAGAPGYYIDLRASRFVDVQRCVALGEEFAMPSFSADDIFALTGATIVGSGHFPGGDPDAAFEQQALAVWDIVQKNPKAWDAFVAYLQAISAGASGSLVDMGPRVLRGGKGSLRANEAVLRRLQEAGVLVSCEFSGKQVRIQYPSLLHKKCLLNQGIWLELYCYIMAKKAGCFGDVRTSVVIDWDGVEAPADSTKNEVDVFMVKDITPVFVSCKMGLPTPLAISEIKLLSEKFGGRGSRTVLVTAAHLREENKALALRARDLGVQLIDMSCLEKQGLSERFRQLV